MLYQRYFLRMNQSNAVHIIWLLLGLVIILLIIYTANTFDVLPKIGPCKYFLFAIFENFYLKFQSCCLLKSFKMFDNLL